MPEYLAPRGTNDVLPDQTPKWEYVESRFREACHLYGFGELRTPTFEHTEVFSRNLGDTTDVVSKEMYTFEDRGGRSITLRPEMTAGAVRAYVQHNLGAALPVSKVYYIGRLYRYERPQSGRYREHTQLGVEAIGSPDPALDAEIIALAVQFYRGVGLDNFELKINSIGCPKCRPGFREALVDYAGDRLNKLCPTCAERREKNPMRMLDCKVPECKEALENAPRMVDYLGDECAEHFRRLQEYLEELRIEYVLDPKLVRGFDYYTKTVFEFISGELGAQNAVGGGGRLDDLVEQLGGPKNTPAIGFGLGLERMMLTLDSMGVQLPVDQGVSRYIVTAGDEARTIALRLLAELRGQGISADMDYTGRSVKAQMKTANKLNAKYAVIIGDDEVASGTAIVRDMAGSEQKSVPLAELVSELR